MEAQAFRRVSQDIGEWSGIVRGNGEIRLALQILERGKVTSTRWIGSVNLADHSTTFHFRSAIPSLPEWTWQIIAAPAVAMRHSRAPS